MLARIAHELYWIGRYVARADDTGEPAMAAADAGGIWAPPRMPGLRMGDDWSGQQQQQQQ